MTSFELDLQGETLDIVADDEQGAEYRIVCELDAEGRPALRLELVRRYSVAELIAQTEARLLAEVKRQAGALMSGRE